MTRRTLLILAATSMLVACLAWALPTNARPPGPSKQMADAVSAAKRAYTLHSAARAAGQVKATTVYFWSTRWLQAGGASPKQLAAHEARMEALLKAVERSVSAGTAATSEAAAARFFVAEARLWRARGSAG